MAEEEDTQGRRRRRSAVWEHFDRFTDADGMDKAGCKRCRKVLAAGTVKNGTSSLLRHVKICCNEQEGARQESPPLIPPPPPPPPPPCAPPMCSSESSRRQPGGLEEKKEEEDRKPALEEAAGTHLRDDQYVGSFATSPFASSQLESLGKWMEKQGEASLDLARMIALHGYDPSIVDDDYFRSFIHHLNPEFSLPPRHAIEEMCDGFFDQARTDLFDKLRRTSGRVSLAVGKSDVIEGGAMYTSCHFIDEEWSLHRIVMDAYDHLPWAQWPPVPGNPDLSQDFYVLYARAIERVMDGVQGHKDGFDRVFMVAQDKRDVLIHPKEFFRYKKFPSSLTNPRKKELICETYMDSVFHHVARRLTLHEHLVKDMTEVHSMMSGVQGLHLTRQKQQHLLSRLELDDPRAYNERWYSCYCYLKFLCGQGTCRIGAIDSALVGLLCSIWGKIYCAIKRISASNGPTSNLVLIELFHVREVLQDAIAQSDGHTADVLRDAMDTLDESIQDSYLVWSLPLVLDPRSKLKDMESCFAIAFHSERAAYYISEVTRHVKKLYDDYIKCDGGISGTSDGTTAMASGRTELLERAWPEHCCAHQDGETELDRYLKDYVSPRTEGFDILKWWKENNPKYPMMARMAREALAMPTSSQLSSEQIAHVRSIIRAYSKQKHNWTKGEISITAVPVFLSFR